MSDPLSWARFQQTRLLLGLPVNRSGPAAPPWAGRLQSEPPCLCVPSHARPHTET